MSLAREGPNPLRPYYIPPSVGYAQENGSLPSSSAASDGYSKSIPSASSRTSFSSSARGILSELDYSDYLSGSSSPSVKEVSKKLLDQALWKYTSVLVAQPFEVARTVLQCYAIPSTDSSRGSDASRKAQQRHGIEMYEDLSSDESDPEELAYFTSHSAAISNSTSLSRHRRDIGSIDRSPVSPSVASHKLELRRSDSLLEVISQLWHKEGAWGVWKGANASFLYSVLLKTIESWTRSLLAAALNVPDPGLLVWLGSGGVSVADSSQPLASLGIAVLAAGFAGVLLSPLDIIRTRLILTPTTHPPRSILSALYNFPGFTCPSSLLPITIIHSTLPSLLNTSTPLVLRSRLGIDPVLSPTTYSILTFLSATAELFIRLPLETVLRRGQAQTDMSSRPVGPSRTTRLPAALPQADTIIDVGPYYGIFGTMWTIIKEEEEEEAGGVHDAGGKEAKKADRKKDQGVQGLWRGWRVGMWGLVGLWGATALGGASGRGTAGAGGGRGCEF